MSEAKHTKGPWRVGVPIAGKINISHLDCTPGAITQNLCWVAARPSWHEEGKANARLIASAPDLLDALQGLVKNFDIDRQWHSARGGDDYGDNLSIAQARAAIAKATEAA